MTISHHSSAKGRLTRPTAAAILALLIFGAQASAQVGANGEIDGLTAKFIDVNGIRTRYYDYSSIIGITDRRRGLGVGRQRPNVRTSSLST